MPLNRRDQALKTSYEEADRVHARGDRLRAALAERPGAYRFVEKHGIRAEDHDDGDLHEILADLNADLADLEERHAGKPAPDFSAARDRDLKALSEMRRAAARAGTRAGKLTLDEREAVRKARIAALRDRG